MVDDYGAGVSFEDRHLLGIVLAVLPHIIHQQNTELYEAVDKICVKQKGGVVLTLLRNSNYRRPDSNKASKVITL